MNRILATVFVCLLLATPAWAGFDEGLAAVKRGDYTTALREWRPLAEQGHAEAQFNLGVMYYIGEGLPQDYAEAVRWYRKAAEQGFADAQYFLGQMYETSQGVPQNYAQAHKWYNIAAAQGDRDARLDRCVLADKMNRALITKAQKLATEWWAAFKKRQDK